MLAIALLSMFSTLGLMAIMGISINLPTQIMPSLLLAIGVGNSVHIFAIYVQALRRGYNKEEALAYSLSHSGPAIVMTNLTTAGGLASFYVAELGPISDFGIVAPIGVAISLIFTISTKTQDG